MKAAFGPGITFAGYRIESLVGRGGMGVVYRATDLSLERPVAVKMIAPELAEDEHFRTRFLREPRLAASLDHPNVIPIYEAGEHEGQLRRCASSRAATWRMLEREGKLEPGRALAVLAQVAGALDAAHRRALVHRDVKPANVLLDEGDHVYLTDFGITKQVGGASTDTGRVVGTLDYLAPEQIRGEDVDGRTDIYALGCVLYECLTGRPPFHRNSEAETLWAHMQKSRPAEGPCGARLRGAQGAREGPGGSLRHVCRACRGRRRGGAWSVRAPGHLRRPHVPPVVRRRAHLILAAGAGPTRRCHSARDRRPHRRRRCRSGTDRQRGGSDRPHGRRRRLIHRVAHGPRQRRRGRGRGLGAQQRGEDGLPNRPGDGGGDEDVPHPGGPQRARRRSGGALGRDRRGGRRGHRVKRDGARVTARSRFRPRHANGAAPRR